MCCVIAVLIFFGPRLAILIWWLLNPFFYSRVFDTWIWPVLFAIFAPWTMIFFLISWLLGEGITGFEWLLIAIGIILDISSYTGGGFSSRRRRKRD